MTDVCTVLLLAVNVLAFLLMAADKKRSVSYKHEKRIPEAVILFPAVLGGAVGTWLGMVLLKHKKHKLLFAVSVPLLILSHLILFVLYLAST